MLSITINNLIADLKPRHKEVISGRYGLLGSDRETLAELGGKYGITRERVRQIEAEALRKISEESKKERLNEIIGKVLAHLKKSGGIKREDVFVDELKNLLKDEALHAWHLKFISEISGGPHYSPESEDFHSYWYSNPGDVKTLNKVINQLERIIASKKEEVVFYGKFHDYLAQVAKANGLDEEAGRNYVSVSRKFKTNPFGDIGLSSWEEIDPRTMASKTYLVIKKAKKPLHFREVADVINKTGFDDKKALPQTIHNELIKDPRFILVGRGIYGLGEQGYLPGTAKEIIHRILKKEGPMTTDKLIDAVGKQRFLEKNTILLNLQNKKYFKRTPEGKYAVIGKSLK